MPGIEDQTGYAFGLTQGAQYTLMKEYTLNYRGPLILWFLR